jgi:hypothetical protein
VDSCLLGTDSEFDSCVLFLNPKSDQRQSPPGISPFHLKAHKNFMPHFHPDKVNGLFGSLVLCCQVWLTLLILGRLSGHETRDGGGNFRGPLER